VWAISVISLKTLVASGLDVPGILQDLPREAQAGKGLDRLKVGEKWERKHK
jgi:hypothetical protein